VTKLPRRFPPPDAKASRASASRSRTTPAIPPVVRALLGPPPITSGENGEAYAQLEAGLAAAIRPIDAIEWIWLKDMADLIWDARRLRRAKRAILAVSRASSMRQLRDKETGDHAKLSIEELRASEVLRALEVKYVLGVFEESQIALPPAALSAIVDAVKGLGERKIGAEADAELAQLTIESEAYRLCLQDLERLDRLVTVADVRRDTVLRDLYRRRELLARQAGPSSLAQVIEAEFEE
jgi:hypothetical protein